MGAEDYSSLAFAGLVAFISGFLRDSDRRILAHLGVLRKPLARVKLPILQPIPAELIDMRINRHSHY